MRAPTRLVSASSLLDEALDSCDDDCDVTNVEDCDEADEDEELESNLRLVFSIDPHLLRSSDNRDASKGISSNADTYKLSSVLSNSFEILRDVLGCISLLIKPLIAVVVIGGFWWFVASSVVHGGGCLLEDLFVFLVATRVVVLLTTGGGGKRMCVVVVVAARVRELMGLMLLVFSI